MTTVESMTLASEAGLHYVTDEIPGMRRIRRGSWLLYVDPQGKARSMARFGVGSTHSSFRRLGTTSGSHRTGLVHILATGYDDAGRKQYIYHPVWEETRDEVKFERMGEFGRRLTQLRRRTDSDLSRPGLSRAKVTALAVAVLDRTLIRVGNRKYATRTTPTGSPRSPATMSRWTGYMSISGSSARGAPIISSSSRTDGSPASSRSARNWVVRHCSDMKRPKVSPPSPRLT